MPGDPVTEAALGERDLRHELGDKAAGLKFLREERSLTTYQNALRTKQLVEEQNLGHQVILVTSVFHMPRAAAVFRAQGFEICALPSYPPSLGLSTFVSYANALQAFGQKLYEAAARDTNAAGSSASGQDAGGSANDEEIVDAEIVDDEK